MLTRGGGGGAPATAPEPSSRRALAGSTVAGRPRSASGIALTATSGWLIVRATTEPIILTLLVAIVAVRTFGIARPFLRYLERLARTTPRSTLAVRRASVYDALVPLTPGRLGRRSRRACSPASSTTSQRRRPELRVRLPVRGFVAGGGARRPLVPRCCCPAAGVLVLGACLVVGAVGLLARPGRRRPRRAARPSSAAPTSPRRSLEVRPGRPSWPCGGRRPGRRAGRRGQPTRSRRRGRGRTLAGRRARRRAGRARPRRRWRWPPWPRRPSPTAPCRGRCAALLVLVPLALGDVAARSPTRARSRRGPRRRRSGSSASSAAPPAVRDTVPGPCPSAPTSSVGDVERRLGPRRARPHRPAPHCPRRAGRRGRRRRARARARSPRCCCASSTRAGRGAARRHRPAPPRPRRRAGPGRARRRRPARVRHAPVVENVRLARPGRDRRRGRAGAAQAPGSGPWLDALPDGLDTLARRGARGGLRRRAGPARRRPLAAGRPAGAGARRTHGPPRPRHRRASSPREVLPGPDDRTVVWITHDPVGLDLVDRVVELAGPSRVDPRAAVGGPARTWRGPGRRGPGVAVGPGVSARDARVPPPTRRVTPGRGRITPVPARTAPGVTTDG